MVVVWPFFFSFIFTCSSQHQIIIRAASNLLEGSSTNSIKTLHLKIWDDGVQYIKAQFYPIMDVLIVGGADGTSTTTNNN